MRGAIRVAGTLYPLVADAAARHGHALFSHGWCWRKGCPGGAYMSVQGQGGTWPSTYIMTRVHIAINGLSCNRAEESHRLQTVNREREDRGDRAWPSPSPLIALSLHPSFNAEKSEGLHFQCTHRGNPALLPSPSRASVTPSPSWFPALKLIPASVVFSCSVEGVEKTTLRLEDPPLIKEPPGLGEALRHTVMAHFRVWLWGEMGTGRGDRATSRGSPRSCRGLLPADVCGVTIQEAQLTPRPGLHGPQPRCLTGLHVEGFSSSEFVESLYQACL